MNAHAIPAWPFPAAVSSSPVPSCRPPRRDRQFAIGTPANPYRPGSGRGTLLAAAAPDRASGLVITTVSPAILHDLALMVELDRHHAVTIDLAIHLAALDADLATVERLAEAGLATRLLVPALAAGARTGEAGETITEASLRSLFDRARQAGAYDVLAIAPGHSPATPRSSQSDRSRRLRPWQRRHRLSVRLVGRSGPRHLPGDAGAAATFRRLRLEYGFPQPLLSRA